MGNYDNLGTFGALNQNLVVGNGNKALVAGFDNTSFINRQISARRFHHWCLQHHQEIQGNYNLAITKAIGNLSEIQAAATLPITRLASTTSPLFRVTSTT